MSKTNIKIYLPKLYSHINGMRTAQGLESLDPETIAVQTNLRFAVVQRRHLNLRQHAIELTLDDAEVLFAIIEELFKVRPSSTNMVRHGDHQELQYELSPTHLYEAIHEQRRVVYRTPIETAVIAVRIGVKFLIMRRRVLDFKAPILILDKADIHAIEQILAEQFSVTLPMGLAALCNQSQTSTASNLATPTVTTASTTAAQNVDSPTWITRMWQHFTGYGGVRQRRYKLDLAAMMVAITQQRSVKGHKYVPPSEIQRRYSERLIKELHLSNGQDPNTIGLTKAQFDTVAALINKEFDVMLPDLNIFIGKTDF